jgi:PAS domain-containing protein
MDLSIVIPAYNENAKITADVRTALPNPIGPGLKPVADGSPVRMIGAMQDITERMQAEEKLRERRRGQVSTPRIFVHINNLLRVRLSVK